MNRFFVLFLLFSIQLIASDKQLKKLEIEIEAIIKNAPKEAHIGIKAISTKDGKVYFSKNSEQLFIPASLTKIGTGASALFYLGSTYQFKTTVSKHGNHLFLKGSGDPTLTHLDLDQVAFQIARSGIKEVKGDIVVDPLVFDDIFQGPGWMWDDGPAKWTARVDGLMVDHSGINIWISPGAEGEKAEVKLEPLTGYTKLENRTYTSHLEGSVQVGNGKFLAPQSSLFVEGIIAPEALPKKVFVAVESPHLYAGYVLKAALEKRGVKVCGRVRKGETPLAVEGLTLLATHDSPPLSEILKPLFKVSDNLYADALFKKMGEVISKGVGSFTSGKDALRKFLVAAGLSSDNMVVLDGCGLSRYNLISPNQFIEILMWVYRNKGIAPEFIAALPIMGEDGSLELRGSEKIKGRVRAKTGSMTGVAGLAGYIDGSDGDEIAFVIIGNQFTQPSSEFASSVIDPIIEKLAAAGDPLPASRAKVKTPKS